MEMGSIGAFIKKLEAVRVGASRAGNINPCYLMTQVETWQVSL